MGAKMRVSQDRTFPIAVAMVFCAGLGGLALFGGLSLFGAGQLSPSLLVKNVESPPTPSSSNSGGSAAAEMNLAAASAAAAAAAAVAQADAAVRAADSAADGAATLTPQVSKPLDFQGLRLGVDTRLTTTEWAASAGLRIRPSPFNGSACSEYTNYNQTYCSYENLDIGASERARVKVELQGLTPDSPLVGVFVRFKSGDYPMIANTLMLKYGEPQQRRNFDLINGLGNRIPAQQLTWTDGSGFLVLDQFAEDLTEGKLSLMVAGVKTREERGPSGAKL